MSSTPPKRADRGRQGRPGELDQLGQINDLVNVADGDGGRRPRSSVRVARQLLAQPGHLEGIVVGHRVGQPVVWGVNGKAALVGTIVRLSANRATVQRIDDPSFGAGAELMPFGAEGAKGIAVGQRDSSLLRFSATDNSPTASVPKKGDVAITLGGARRPEVSAAGC